MVYFIHWSECSIRRQDNEEQEIYRVAFAYAYVSCLRLALTIMSIREIILRFKRWL